MNIPHPPSSGTLPPLEKHDPPSPEPPHEAPSHPEIPEIIRRSRQAFLRELLALLATHPGQWAAYSGDTRIVIADSSTAAVQECLAQGYARGDFIVSLIEPYEPPETDHVANV